MNECPRNLKARLSGPRMFWYSPRPSHRGWRVNSRHPTRLGMKSFIDLMPFPNVRPRRGLAEPHTFWTSSPSSSNGTFRIPPKPA